MVNQEWIDRAFSNIENGNNDKVIYDCNIALQKDSNDKWAYMLRGYANFQVDSLDKPERAISDYNRALQIDPNFAKCLFARGMALYIQGDKLSARTDFRRAAQFGDEFSREILRTWEFDGTESNAKTMAKSGPKSVTQKASPDSGCCVVILVPIVGLISTVYYLII